MTEPICKDWKSIRPWLPPTGLTNRFELRSSSRGTRNESSHLMDGPLVEEEGYEGANERSRKRLSLNVIDISSTAITLDVSLSFPEAASIPLTGHSPDTLVIRINGQPWNKILHANSDLVGPILNNAHANGIILVIYGLDPGDEYNVELEVIPNPGPGQDEMVEEVDLDKAFHCQTFATSRDHHHSTSNALSSASSGAIYLEKSIRDEIAEESNTKLPEPVLIQPEPDGPPPPYTSHDPASPTTATPISTGSHSHSSSRDFNPEPSHQRPPSSSPPSTVIATRNEGEVIVNTGPSKSARNELKLISSIDHMTKSLNKTVKENVKLKQKLVNLEQFIRRLDDENLVKSNKLESLGRLSEEDLKHEIEAEQAKLREKRAALEVQEKARARQLADLKERNRASRRKVDESARRLSELREKKLKTIDTELSSLKSELEEVDRLIAADVREPQPPKKPASTTKTVTRSTKAAVHSHQGKMRSVEELRSRDSTLSTRPVSVWAPTSSGSQKKFLGRTGSLNEKSRPGMIVGANGVARRGMKENQQVNKTWADKVAGH
ncbi:hypothetical protein CROQUDRAFT_658109 [Cronartium quercuum f. sp. fusiforme G11]|uniref:Uncharacterized protein n=1 Tax=Cronartium quercuum f. sp. fusiforme G11 TaxID=708437 RepID=A0A9P6NHS8_9BASI|nr:hypothetical protein CROQUDRAFT_658109 [Cronartium quercuum f. sp. fusiforme G11]